MADLEGSCNPSSLHLERSPSLDPVLSASPVLYDFSIFEGRQSSGSDSLNGSWEAPEASNSTFLIPEAFPVPDARFFFPRSLQPELPV